MVSRERWVKCGCGTTAWYHCLGHSSTMTVTKGRPGTVIRSVLMAPRMIRVASHEDHMCYIVGYSPKHMITAHAVLFLFGFRVASGRRSDSVTNHYLDGTDSVSVPIGSGRAKWYKLSSTAQ